MKLLLQEPICYAGKTMGHHRHDVCDSRTGGPVPYERKRLGQFGQALYYNTFIINSPINEVIIPNTTFAVNFSLNILAAMILERTSEAPWFKG